MGLKEYNRKRDFGATPEPTGGDVRARHSGLAFVVQKHAARRLHYDFRIEIDGVLKSWAVPKGPSLVPGERRLAVQTEDHPLEYKDFEGTIPEGNYGAGKMEIWDRGEWEPIGDPHQALAKGSLPFRLHGKRLRGGWRLVRMPKSEKEKQPSWLLLKSRDEGAAAEDRLPEVPEPQLATLVAAPPKGPGWLHEIKLDGYRIICRLERGVVRLISRNGLDWTDNFPTVAEAAAGLACDSAILDGEVVVLDEQGISRFQLLQQALGARRPDVRYVVFDLLHLDGKDLRGLPLVERKELLRELLPDDPQAIVRYGDHVEGDGDKLWREACRLDVEGVISKQRDAPYRSGRSKGWLKAKCHRQQEMVIIGFTDPGGGRKGLGALVLGVHDDDKTLRYAGKVGTGFSDRVLAELRARLEPMREKTTTAKNVPRPIARAAHWVRPELVAQVRFTEWTEEGHARHPAFLGLREDKPARAVTVEKEQPVSKPGPPVFAGVRLSNPEKVLWPDAGVTKRELAGYYQTVAPLMLPMIERRPLMLLRCPHGVGHDCFFQKHTNRMTPADMPRVVVDEDEAPNLMLDGLRSLIQTVQLGALELHVWGSRAETLETPDFVVFDLDPDPGVSWKRVLDTARLVEEHLEALGMRGFPRVTGGKGLHVVVPLAPKAVWADVKAFCHALALAVVRTDPRGLTAELAKSQRKDKIFIDYLRNGRGATAICSYSTRARPGAPVAMPLRWDQLDPKPEFPLRHAAAWAAKHPDPWPDWEKARFKGSVARLRKK